MRDELSATERAAVARAEAFAAEIVAPGAASWEADRRLPREAYDAAGRAGLLGLLVPEALAGSGLGNRAMTRVVERLARADMAFAFSLVVHNNLAGNIARNGSAEQQARLLPDLLAGRRIGAFLLTEPGAGSDAQAITTQARAAGDGWVIEGEKAWVSNAQEADVLSVYAQTDPGTGGRGIACFLIDAAAPGVERLGPYSLHGGHALGTGGFRFRGVRVTAGDRLLAPGAAFKAALAGIDIARANVGALCAGMMQAGLDHALGYMAERQAFGHRLADFQGLQWMMADVATDLAAVRLLTDHAAGLIDAGGDAALAAAHAKKFAARAATRGLADCMQVMGANGYRAECPISRHLANARMCHLIDGTTEIQNVVIARALMAGTEPA